MLVEAKLMKEVQERAKENYREYKKLEECISEKILFAASVGSNYCDYTICGYKQKDVNNLEKIATKLNELGYGGRLLITPKVIELNITW